MSKTIKINRGLDLRLKGELPADATASPVKASIVAIYPDDYPGFTPKPAVHEGDKVNCGDVLLFDKLTPGVKLVSPVSGIVKAIVRGERRKIIRVEVEADKDATTLAKNATPKTDATANAIMASGLWCLMRQRPYDIIPSPDVTPVNIFVTGFDSAPLAPSLSSMVKGMDKELEAGAQALAKLTSGKVFVSTRPDSQINVPACAEHVIIEGAHPAGNPGVQAANIQPVNKGETIWTLDIVTMARIGRLVLDGSVDWNTTVALVGSEVKTPRLITTATGACITPIIKGDVDASSHHIRVISGNVLTGENVGADGFLRYPYRQVTVIPEGDDVDEFMGWASMSPSKMSASRSFLSSLLKGKRFAPDARLNGGRRAMIMSEQYDKVMPMDILPEYLIKAILARDIDQMERLGIYEVAPEDFALCEYVDPSKLELQKIVREGLDYLRKELA